MNEQASKPERGPERKAQRETPTKGQAPTYIQRTRERQKQEKPARRQQGGKTQRIHRRETAHRQQNTTQKKEEQKNTGERGREGDTEGKRGGGIQTGEAAGAETAQDRQARTLQTSYEPSRPLLDRSLKEAIEGEVLRRERKQESKRKKE